MRNLKTIRKEAGSVAKAANCPLGPRPLQRVVCDHIGFFAGLRAEGASWEQIAALLDSEGLRSRAGGVVSAGVLRALCSRAAKGSASRAPRAAAATMPRGSGGGAVACPAAPPSVPVSREPADGSLAAIIARAARLRGFTEGTD